MFKLKLKEALMKNSIHIAHNRNNFNFWSNFLTINKNERDPLFFWNYLSYITLYNVYLSSEFENFKMLILFHKSYFLFVKF